ncbi:hypothetical protein ABZ915_05170 [Streptomyces sp. NPDC046915]|uniref:hypothetical protein n=1 Tax=Streptomyces sp. NPDC046915 TaxID=3155257 RepID=UPI0033E7470D
MYTHVLLSQHHMAELRAQADAYRLAAQAPAARRPGVLRTRLGWTLVEVGLRLAATREPSPAMA